MKKLILALIFAHSSLALVHAEFEWWTNADGNRASMELIEVIRDGDKVTGKFKLEDGREVSLPVERFAEESAARILDWKPKVEIKSVFDELLDGNLVKLDGRRFAKYELTTKPEKYYVFYYTASWCPPCRAYTPELVRFYNSNRDNGNHFELILVSSDQSEKDMLSYAQDGKMPWPMIRFSKVKKIRSELGHRVRGIPAVIVCDLEGNVVSNNRNLNHLKELLNP